ncbi:MAG TPA: transposase [Candidatus Acidoferrum sp.]
MTHPGVGPVTALATDVFLGDPQRFADGKALASFLRTLTTPEQRSYARESGLFPLLFSVLHYSL